MIAGFVSFVACEAPDCKTRMEYCPETRHFSHCCKSCYQCQELSDCFGIAVRAQGIVLMHIL